MTNEKRPKPKIKRRPPGLVITPPVPRPVGDDHPARLLFRAAIESAREPAVPAAPTEAQENVERHTTPDVEAPGLATVPQTQAEPLQIFKELREAATTVEAPVGFEVEETAVPAEESQPFGEVKEEVTEVVPSSDDQTFEIYFAQWRPFFTEAQVSVLKALFKMTHAKGEAECLSSMPRLAAAADISERQTYNVVRELEGMGFIERPETFNTRTKKGTVFRLLLSRRDTPGPERRYHLGD